MSIIVRAKLRKDIDELNDEQYEEFLKLIRPFIEKKAQENRPWAKELYALYEPLRNSDPNSNATTE